MGMLLRTSHEQAEALRRQAEIEGRSQQAIVRDAIEQYIAVRAHKAKVETVLQRVIGEEAAVLKRLADT